MKKLISVLLILAMVISLAACGSSEPDPNAGIYYGTYGTYSGFSMAVEELFEGGCSLELKNGGKGKSTGNTNLDDYDYGADDEYEFETYEEPEDEPLDGNTEDDEG